MSAYSPPIDRLLRIGWNDRESERKVASEFGLSAEHIPALAQLATDKELWLDWHEPESIATSHALSALAELGAIDRVPGILDLISELDHDYLAGDWVTEEMGDFLAAFGPEIVPILKAELPRRDRTIWMLSATAKALRLLAEDLPARLRAEVIDAISNELERRDDPDPELNGLLLSHLLDLAPTEAAQIIERAFADGLIDESMCGDWPEVRYELGLGPKPPPRRRVLFPPPVRSARADLILNPKERAEQRKSKRKAAKRARKRNRVRQ